MPTNATDTDVFPANVQRPNNGELADSGSLSQGFNPLTQRTRYVYNRLLTGIIDVTRAPYSADLTGVADSTAAITAAIAAAQVTGGIVWFPAGTYLYTQLLITSGVTIRCVPDRTFLVCTHATFSQIVFSGANNGPPIQIHDARFLSSIVSTGACVVNNSGGRVQLVRCSWNGVNAAGAASNNLQGKILHSNLDTSETHLVDCSVKVVGDVNGLHAQRGKVIMDRGSLVMPATFNNALLRGENTAYVAMRDVEVDCTARTAGGAVAVMHVDAGVTATMRDCELDGSGAVGTIYGFLWSAGARVTARGNRWILNITPYAGNLAVAGSSVELKDYLPVHVGAAATYTIADGVRSVTVASSSTSATFTLTMPAKLFAGQHLSVSVFNDASGVSWTGITTTGMTHGSLTSLDNNTGRSFEAMVVDRNLDGTLDWVIVGPWSAQWL
jgi:hypothetical protein